MEQIGLGFLYWRETSKFSGVNWTRFFVLKGNNQNFWSKLDSNFCTDGKHAKFPEQIGLEFLYWRETSKISGANWTRTSMSWRETEVFMVGQSWQAHGTHRHSNEIQSNHHQLTICFKKYVNSYSITNIRHQSKIWGWKSIWVNLYGVKIMLQVFGTVCIHRILPNIDGNQWSQWLPVGEVYWWEEASQYHWLNKLLPFWDMIGTWIVTWIHWSLIGTLLIYHSNRSG